MENFDVAIVGGGIIGCSIAFELAAEKIRTVLVDRQEPGKEASWAAAGMLSPAPDSPRDIPLVPLSKASLSLYPEFVQAVEEAAGKATGYARPGALQIFSGDSAQEQRDSMAAEHRALGLRAEQVSLAEARQMEPALSEEAGAALWLREEGTVEPRLFMETVLTAARKRGAEIRPGCGVRFIAIEGNRCSGVITEGGKIGAGHVIVAAGCFSAAIASETSNAHMAIPMRPVRGQMLAMRRRGFRLAHVLRSERGYLVPRADGHIVAGSTLEDAGFDKSVTAGGVGKILEAAFELCPELGGAELLETWAGLRPGTPDDLPILGPGELEGVILATGHYRNGILLAPITAKLVRDWVLHGRTSFNAEAFSPVRFRNDAKSGAGESAGGG